MKIISAVCGVLLMNSVWAAPDMVVEGVKMPTWIERGLLRFPASPGMALNNNDVLLTGSGARLLLRAADGSVIKLGENARLQLSGLGTQASQPVFTAVLEVAKGAFRFTTGLLAKLRERQVTVKVANATIGIRGTDVWGKAGGKMEVATLEKVTGQNLERADKNTKVGFDVVCLLEGKISVTHGNETPFEMDQPQTFYVMPQDTAPLPVSSLPPEQMRKWATETEIAVGQGAMRSGGKWKINLLAANSEQEILVAYDALRAAGYAVRILPLVNGQYQLRITQLPDRAEAEALARELTGKMGIVEPMVTR